MFGNLFIRPFSPKTLMEFGQEIRRDLGLIEITERESSSYKGGLYLATKSLGVAISLSLTDDADFFEYPFHLSMKADGYWVDEGDAFEYLADLIARKLTLVGYSVARCPDFGCIGATILRYTVKAGLPGNGRHEIEVASTLPPSGPDS